MGEWRLRPGQGPFIGSDRRDGIFAQSMRSYGMTAAGFVAPSVRRKTLYTIPYMESYIDLLVQDPAHLISPRF